MRYDFEESVVAEYTGVARTELNQSFEYVCKSVPLLRRYPCEHLSSVNNRHNVVKYVQTYDKYIQKLL